MACGYSNLKLEMLITTQKFVFNFELPSLRNAQYVAKFSNLAYKAIFGPFLRLGWSKLKTDFCVVFTWNVFSTSTNQLLNVW